MGTPMELIQANDFRHLLTMARDLMNGRQSSLESLRRLRRWLLWNERDEHARLIRYFESLGTEGQGELKRALSTGQIESKLWLIEILSAVLPNDRSYNFVIAGGWVGSLPYLLDQLRPNLVNRVTQLDIEPSVNRIARGWNAPLADRFQALDRDAIGFDYDLTAEVIVNTSCEHFTAQELSHWLRSLPKGRIVALQSNNFYGEPGHVNCHYSVSAFCQSLNVQNVLFSGELDLGKYKRFMTIFITHGPN